MRIRYDGTDFLGWQRQPEGRTVQSVLEEMLTKVSGNRPVTVIGAGRTDSGVHASGQVAHADVRTRYGDADLLHALRRMSPPDLSIDALLTVSPDFHARFQACRRAYRYRIISRPDPFLARYSWLHEPPLDHDLLQRAAALLPGRRDFTPLSKHNPDTPNMICEVVRAEWHRSGEGLDFHIAADRFLYGMVRLLVGIQVDIARGRRSLEELAVVLDSADRSSQSMSAPAHGLTLVEVGYPEPIFEGDAGVR